MVRYKLPYQIKMMSIYRIISARIPTSIISLVFGRSYHHNSSLYVYNQHMPKLVSTIIKYNAWILFYFYLFIYYTKFNNLISFSASTIWWQELLIIILTRSNVIYWEHRYGNTKINCIKLSSQYSFVVTYISTRYNL